MRAAMCLVSVISLVLVQSAWGEAPTTKESGRIDAADAVHAEKVADRVGDVGQLDLRSLPVVLDAINRHQDWHEAARQAEERVPVPQMRSHLAQQLSALVPHVSKELLAHPSQVALVTVAIYKDSAQGKPAMVGVTYNGTEAQVPPSFFSDLLADFPEAPKAKGLPEKLTLDREASSYLIFSVFKGDLKASDVPHEQMKKSLGVAMNQVAAKEAKTQSPPNRVTGDQERAAQQPPSGGSQTISQVYPNGDDGTYGYGNGYYGVGVPIYIVPSGPIVWTREDLRRFRQRQRERENRFHQGPNVAHQPNAVANQPNAVAHQPNAVANQPNETARQPNSIARQPNQSTREPDHTARQPNESARQPANQQQSSQQSSPPPSRTPPAQNNSGGEQNNRR